MALGADLREGLQKLSQVSPETTILNYDHIELDEIELEEALRKAREEKHFRLKRQAYSQRLVESPRWFIPSAIELKNVLLTTSSKNGNPFEVTEFNREVIDQLCLYFSSDPNFKGDPKKGIMLMGNPGVGKTHLMNFFAKNPKASYIIPTCKIITERYSNKWSHEEKSTIEYYSELKRAEVGHQWDQVELGACFGDLGAEAAEASSYGNRKNVMEEIVFNRYEANLPFYMTHFTTNLNADELGTKYGQRFRDRIREMCNVYTIKGDSFRR